MPSLKPTVTWTTMRSSPGNKKPRSKKKETPNQQKKKHQKEQQQQQQQRQTAPIRRRNRQGHARENRSTAGGEGLRAVQLCGLRSARSLQAEKALDRRRRRDAARSHPSEGASGSLLA